MGVIWIDSRRFVTSGGGGGTDPDFANVSLLLHMDGSNGSTTFTDSSSNSVSVTANGNAQISTAQSKFGGASGLFDGSGDSLTATVNTFNTRTDKFTIESWVYLASRTGFTLISGTNFYLTELGGTVYLGDGSANIVQFANTELPLTTWFHIAVTFDQTTYRIFVDGVDKGNSTLLLASFNFSNVEIGARASLSSYTDGYLDDYRITKDVARYTAGFTPPTAAFPDS